MVRWFREYLRKVGKLAVVVGEPEIRRGLAHGVAGAVEHLPLIRTLDFDFCVDVGANRGQFGLVVRAAKPLVPVVFLEPLAGPAEKLQRLFGRDERAAIIQKACSRQPGLTRMQVAMSDDSSSLLEITSAQTDLYPGTGLKEEREVEVTTLDEVVRRFCPEGRGLLKIDVQGGERGVLEGGESELGRFAFILVECSFVELYRGQALVPEIVGYLAERSFGLTGIHNMIYDESGRSVQGDFLFRPIVA